MKLIFIVFSLFFSLTGHGQICENYLDDLPLQQGGRVKPLFVHAKEVVKYLTDKSSLNGESPAITFCKLSLLDNTTFSSIHFPTPHVELQKLLGISSKTIPAEKAISSLPEIRSAYMEIEEDTSYKKALQKMIERIQLFQSVTDGQNWTFPIVMQDKLMWGPLSEVKRIKKDPLSKEYLLELKNKYIEKEGDHYLLENTYVKSHLTGYALLTAILTVVLVVLVRNQYVALSMAVVTLLLQMATFAMRVMISGRAPITNMYETVLFSGFGALTLALIIGHMRKEKIFILVGASYNMITLFMSIFANEMLDSSIKPLVPVLRDNFWLSTHVTTIILSYSGLALSWVLSNIVLFKRKFSHFTAKEENYYADLIYTAIKWGTVLLAAGIILGGVWADYSWGRFWGWDPKETWSLIVLCIYMAILHGKFTNWIPKHRFIHLTAGAFMSVMMAWFGVNYILASGLHSYGFSQGGAIFLGSFFALQTAILVLFRNKVATKD